MFSRVLWKLRRQLASGKTSRISFRPDSAKSDLLEQSYSPSTRMTYTNPFPALKDYMRRMQDISDQRYEDGYDSTSSDEGASPPRSGRARRDPGDGSDSEDDYYPVNPYLQRVRAQGSSSATVSSDATVRIGISKTPKNGLACPTCRAQPVVDATGSCLVTSMVELVQKVQAAGSRLAIIADLLSYSASP